MSPPLHEDGDLVAMRAELHNSFCHGHPSGPRLSRGCGGGLDSTTATLSHEYAEAATDPYLDAWGNGGSTEIADACDQSFALQTSSGPYLVQQLWSNATSACVQQ